GPRLIEPRMVRLEGDRLTREPLGAIGAGFGPLVLERLVTGVKRPAFPFGPLPAARTGRLEPRRVLELLRRRRRPRPLRGRRLDREPHRPVDVAGRGPRSPPGPGVRLL
ncbi:MAG: hypothetical protein ACRD0U_16795, partial [Acidimicrobiales bacterium]